MIDAPRLLKDLQRLLKELEDDLRERAAEVPEIDEKFRDQYRDAQDAGRTGQAFEVWREEYLTQVAVAWILGCVFVRFMEDNGLVDTPRLSGPGERRQHALDQHELYFQDPERRTHSDREYLLDVFEQTQKLPAARELFDAKLNPLWVVGLSGDGATQLLQFWQRLDPETGALDHDFTDPDWNTRFLGDLYQDLSESARKRYALLQTPEFVEEFILDRTLTPAIEEFGFQEVRLIDPTCGSGHFLLGAFHRLFDLWVKYEPGTSPRELVQRALDQVYGVDLNPYAVAIARFRLLVEALKSCGVKQLASAPAFEQNFAAGDSLLHGSRPGKSAHQQYLDASEDPLRHVYQTEDAEALRRILGQAYHAVVGNPPYITPKDKALTQAYRDAYSSCYRQYSLGVPFTERFFELAVARDASQDAGFVGMITANSFMKREFGKKLIEETLPKLDLTHVIDTSGAYIPGHGTPTVILLGRNRTPIGEAIRTAMGIRGEPGTPEDPTQGRVWQAIVRQLDSPGSESELISVADYPRERFNAHPWSLGGGGAAELKEAIEAAAEKRLGKVVESIGFMCITKQDEVFAQDADALQRAGIPDERIREFGIGEDVRDWGAARGPAVIFPYDSNIQTLPAVELPDVTTYLWPWRTTLWDRKVFGGATYREVGKPWYEYGQIPADRFRTPLSITFAFVATHNHFVLDRGGKVFKQSAPVIKLPAGASEDDHLALLALLNSSTACFWIRQVTQPKTQTTGMDQDGWRVRREFDGTKLLQFPIAVESPRRLAVDLDGLAQELVTLQSIMGAGTTPTAKDLRAAQDRSDELWRKMIGLQEELDWSTYRAYGLIEENLCAPSNAVPPIRPSERAFAVVLARRQQIEPGITTWFEYQGFDPVTELPDAWPDDYRRVVERRIALIESDRNIRLIEQPEYKRRWNTEPFEEVSQRALRSWLLDRLEAPAYWPVFELQSAARLADRANQDADFMQVAELYTGRPDFDVSSLVRDLVEAESVPALAACRYKAPGLRKRVQWEQTWELQRQEDAIDARTALDAEDPQYLPEEQAAALKRKEVGDIPVPPKYASADFQKGHYWRLRGKLDVPKERFVSFPYCEREADPSPVVGWAGWDPLQLAQATAAFYLEMKEQEGWPADRLTPLLLALLEVLPWVKQWHNALDPQNQVRMGDYFEDFVNEEARSLSLTPEQIEAWTPPAKTRTRKPRKKVAPKKTEPEAKPV